MVDVPAIEIADKEVTGADRPSVKVASHWNYTGEYDGMITLVLPGGERVTVLARDLEYAIKVCHGLPS